MPAFLRCLTACATTTARLLNVTDILAAHAEMADPPARLHFYRTHAQAEVDFVLARGRRMIALEVKASATVRPSDAKGIEELATQFPRECPFGVVLYLGRSVLPLTEHAAAVPLAAFFAP